MRLQEDLERASTVVRLEKVISTLQQRGIDLEWEPKQREWFLSFLLPFSETSASSYRLSPSAPEPMAIDHAVVLEELIAQAADVQAVQRELEGLMRLYKKLAVPSPTLAQEDADRALRLARAVRSRLLATFPSSPPIVATVHSA